MTLIILLSHLLVCQSQGFLRVEDINIINDEGPFIIRSIGTGNWMIQEGYMMQSTDAGINTHTQFRNKLNETMGVERTNEFYAHWLEHHFTKTDLDSLKAWGFNTIRPALHYKWFTLPIEEEERNSNGTIQNTWFNKGFDKLDKLVAWCEENQMYVIFDMHGAPGGQGKDANISDYDQTLPSLWESNDNQEKLIALWTKIAERYKNNPWVGGYDIINEPNWDVDGNTQNENGCECQNNGALWSLHQRITNAIRSVDKTHIIFISGNCWGNNYNGFENHALNGYDDNTVLTFHKYWNSNAQNAIQWAIDMRQQYNMPLWMSESGENSNHWFAEAIELFERNNIGWSWWPVKKSRLNNVLKVTTNEDYYELVNSWKDGSKPLSVEETCNAVMAYADAHKIENCTIAPDVMFALNSGSHTRATKPYMHHKTEEWIQCVHYDLGKDGDAYHDALSEDIHDSSGKWAKWNVGNHFRNDGVDIGKDGDGYYIGWTEPGEWLQYTINAVQSGYYKLDIMSAAATAGGQISILVNGAVQASNIQLPVTESGEEWNSTQIKKIYLPAGEVKVRIRIESGGSNLKAFKLTQYSELSVREGKKLASSHLADSGQ
ncbi:cellulase family glycosylhydrolase [Carboxylicivirga mesophila]|uniref:Cellulase family glycosylhydrolase n=1 Tax=Carboxylicivirga mesophila TaxID=1166478 RepID=A0ABS5K983_9BACT|nr:cellulase family glycosylhydrolase [Carboxylicivirga mesophila]MBS2211422.1 cellulase family glycosylhydrolase [Carboxylicivirga mesophila]